MKVDYILDEEETKRLNYITELYNKASGNYHTPEQTFSALMIIGSASDIRQRMDFAEHNFSAIIANKG